MHYANRGWGERHGGEWQKIVAGLAPAGRVAALQLAGIEGGQQRLSAVEGPLLARGCTRLPVVSAELVVMYSTTSMRIRIQTVMNRAARCVP